MQLEVQLLEGRTEVHGRGYVTSDAPLVQALGVGAGFVAALVLSLYLNSEEVLLLYQTPQIVWGAVLILLYWISSSECSAISICLIRNAVVFCCISSNSS